MVKLSPLKNFQSTKPQGLRQFRQLEIVEEEAISIHEATRASTMQTVLRRVLVLISIHEATRAST